MIKPDWWPMNPYSKAHTAPWLGWEGASEAIYAAWQLTRKRRLTKELVERENRARRRGFNSGGPDPRFMYHKES